MSKMDEAEFHTQKNTSHGYSTFEKIKSLVDFQNGKNLSILDVGCGQGSLDIELAQFGHTVTGLDVNLPQTSPSNPHVNFIATDITKPWPVQNASFDLVICTDVPEHMYNPMHVLEEAQRLLKPQGQLIFGVPNHFDLRQRLRTLFGKGIVHWDNLRHNESAWNYAHIRFFTHQELIKQFVASGWHVDTAQFNFMGAGIVPARLLPKFARNILLKLYPGLFSGKFIYLLSPQQNNQKTKYIYRSTPKRGM
ncbi:MAG TPA: class I SAM-dependent methyltransferase [Patescibacteria group bacterium]|jgi:2-polyprenyl-3-methyl-5-hydroxy-6-metoxy-1,4-benzoquinol methylase|nr:class I SAM-dependent methyltransferase [Patescibacteria group bacterium]